jgi:hypothetical protein
VASPPPPERTGVPAEPSATEHLTATGLRRPDAAGTRVARCSLFGAVAAIDKAAPGEGGLVAALRLEAGEQEASREREPDSIPRDSVCQTSTRRVGREARESRGGPMCRGMRGVRAGCRDCR